jgi:ElaA protein
MKLEWKIKTFNELSNYELYDLLRLRSQIFVVEQNCVFLDMDSKDDFALHLIGTLDGKILAYARLFNAGDYYENASIGRVVIDENYRDKKWGNDLMTQAIAGISSYFNQTKITIGAQLYLQKFYEKHGFVVTSEVYLEDDINHVEMKIQ